MKTIMKDSPAPAPLDFAALMEAVQSQEARTDTVDIDVSAFLGAGAVITFRELDTARMFTIPSDAAMIQKANIDWPMELCASVSMLALAHVAPKPEKVPVGQFYIQVAKKNRDLFTFLIARYRAEFPAVSQLGEVTEDQRKD